MLKRLVVKNFQKHRAFAVDFDPHVTVFWGPNDAGKSAVLRALKWVCLNRPSGTRFITTGEGACQVRLFVDDRKIVRDRSRKITNEYRLDGRVYKSFGQGNVPADVEALLNVDDNNFQSQLAAPFWFSLPSAIVSKELNRVVNLDVIDATLAAASLNAHRAKSREQELRRELEKAERDIRKLEWVEEAHEEYCAIEQLECDIIQKRTELHRIESALQQVESLAASEKVSQSRANAISRILETLERLVACEQSVSALQSMINTLNERDEAWRSASTRLREIETPLNDLIRGGCPLCGQPTKKIPSSSSERATGISA